MSQRKILVSIYESYTGSLSTGMTSSKFLKIMKDSNLLDNNLRQPDVDLIFTKCKATGQRTIDLEGFKRGLEMIASRKDVSFNELVDYIQMTTAEGPSYAGTTIAQETRFYDDKETYTGVHKAGGPTVVDRDKQGLENLLDRSDADVRGLKKDMREAHGRPVLAGKREYGISDGISPTNSPPIQKSSSSGNIRPAPSPSTSSSSSGGGLYREPKSHEALLANLENRLQRMGVTPETQTSPQIKLSTKQSLAAHLNSRVTPPVTPSQPQNHHHHQQQQQQQQYSPPPSTLGYAPAPTPPTTNSRTRTEIPNTPPPVPVSETRSIPPKTPTNYDPEAALLSVFKTFCTNDPEGRAMDSARFVKYCRDTKIIGSIGHLTSVDADLIFQKAKKAGNYGKRITYEDFRMVAIPELAKRIGCSVEEVITISLRSEGPTLNNATTPNEVRFHDDISTYTGVHSDGHNPSFTPTSSKISLEELLDRSPADNRGVKLSNEAAAAANSSSAQKPKRPVIAGEANKSGGIYDRLSQQDSYTGVYRERFNQQGTSQPEFRGHTNTGTDQPIHDISKILNRR
mmetsp:Transcript_19373/g.20098  ORF Transcript_19373/g.20098 Transcript_19373/m.20098 type:complete len:569 (+) Transcript_19373:14-1720(+)